jgi:hypothetical protein
MPDGAFDALKGFNNIAFEPISALTDRDTTLGECTFT